MTSLVSQEPGLATIPESPTGECANSPRRISRNNGGPAGTMSQYAGQNGSGGGGGNNNVSNGYPEENSPNSSQLSSDGGAQDTATLISRTQKQHTTQQVTTTTKTIREVQYLGPDGQPLDLSGGHPPPVHPRLSTSSNPAAVPTGYEHFNGPPAAYDPRYADYEHFGPAAGAHPGGGGGGGGGGGYANYAEYPHRAPTPPSPSERSASPPPQHREPDYMRQSGSSGSNYLPRSGYDELDTTLMPPRPGEHFAGGVPNPAAEYGLQHHEPLQHHSLSADDPHHPHSLQDYDPNNSVFESPGSTYPSGAPRAIFDDEGDPAAAAGQNSEAPPPPLMKRTSRPSLGSTESRGAPGVQWRDPDLHEVIEFLNNPNSVIKANAAAYLQHLCYMDDPVKAKTRQLGGIPPLVALLSHEVPEIHRNACGALRNLSYGRQNDENKRAIKDAGGVTALVRLLRRTTDNEVKDLVTGVLWNLSSCDDLKRPIVDEALLVLVNIVIIPHSGWDPNGPGTETVWSTVFRNASGILRNVSSAGDYGRRKLRECDGVVDSMLHLVKKAIEKASIDNKSVENCVCVLRNLSYRAQEVEDPNYDKRQLPSVGESRAGAKPGGDNLGCFGGSGGSGGKKKDGGMQQQQQHPNPTNPSASSRSHRSAAGMLKGMELLWQPEVVLPYLNLLSNCSNPETLEAAAGAIQNLSACYWQPSIDVRAAVRKEKGLPILVELLRMEVDRVVCAVATALRNLAIDQRNKELIGKYAMRDLVQKLPSGNPQHDQGTSDDTIAAVLATLNEVIKKHPEFSRSLLEAGGVERLMTITRQRGRFSTRVVKFASQVLYSMWVHQELREVYRKAGWKEQDFVTKTIAAASRNNQPHSNSTLNRPMASQGGTRYEDRTMQRGGMTAVAAHQPHNNVMQGGYRPEDVPMENLSLYGRMVPHHAMPPPQVVPMYQPANHHNVVRPGEPVYAQVNRDKKKNSRGGGPAPGGGDQMIVAQQQQTAATLQLLPPGYHDYSDHADHWQAGGVGVALDQGGGGGGGANVPAAANTPAGDSWV